MAPRGTCPLQSEPTALAASNVDLNGKFQCAMQGPTPVRGLWSFGMATFVVRRATDDISRSIEYYQVWFYLALDDILARYRNTILGPLWNASYIIAQGLAFSLVFGLVFHQPLHILMPYILSGLVGWSFGPSTILECSGLLIWFAGTIKTQSFPFLFYAFRVVARSGLMFLHNLAALLVVLPLFGHMPVMSLTIIPAAGLIMLVSAPYSLMLGMICARFRDIQMFVMNFSNVLFIMTPVFWMPSASPGIRNSAFLVFNPLYYMVDLIRQPLLNVLPSIQDWLVCGGIAAIGWAACFVCLSTFRARIPFWV
jgi:lipopolysaccharide transport system permease protein